MDNATMARLLEETADLLEIDGGDSFRIRSYRRAAEAAEQTTVDLVAAAPDTARLLEIPGIGKSMAANLQAIAETGTLPLRDELLARYGAGLLELLKLPGMGPKTVALLWDCGKDLPASTSLPRPLTRAAWPDCRAWAQSRLKSSARASTITGAAPGGSASTRPTRKPSGSRPICWHFKGIERVTPAGSLRRGRETSGRSRSAGDRARLRAGTHAAARSSTSPPIPASTT